MTRYEQIGVSYAKTRGTDPRIGALISAGLGDAQSVVNVGAGTGSYEPQDRLVIAVEPSWRMIAQRSGAGVVVQGVAEALPLRDQAVDAALAVLTIHHWPDQQAGVRELVRVARRRVVLFTFDGTHPGFWLTQDYFPQFLVEDRRIMPSSDKLGAMFDGGALRVEPIRVPSDCADGFLGAYWKRPQAYLDPAVRIGISSFALADPATLEEGLRRLKFDLESGQWERRHGAGLAAQESLDTGYRLLIWTPSPILS